MKRSSWVRYLLVVLFLLTLIGPARAARAASVPCSTAELIAAITAANASTADDTITLQSGCVYLLTASNNTALGANGLPVIAGQAGKLTINGNGATIMRGQPLWIPAVMNAAPAGAPAASASSAAAHPDSMAANGATNSGGTIENAGTSFRIFRIAAGGNLTLNNVTLTGGFLADGNGGAISNSGTLTVSSAAIKGNSAVMGGGIFNLGTLTVTNSAITSNTAVTIGGGISSGGALTVSDTTFSRNNAVLGDGLFIAEGSSLVNRPTFSDDSAYTCPAFPYTVPEGDVAQLVNAIHCANGGPSSSVINLTKGSYILTAADNPGFGEGDTGLPVVWDAAESGTLTINGSGAVIQRSEGEGKPNFRIWLVHSGGSLALNQVTMYNGSISGFNGGGIYVQSGQLTLNHATVSNSRAEYGGGIAANDSTVTLADSTITFNTAAHDGAAMNMNGALKMTNSEITLNSAVGLGGGVLLGEGTHEITNSTFAQNRSTAPASGGALLVISLDGSLTTVNVSGCTFSYNNGTGGGGAVFTTPNTVTNITNSTFTGNSAGWGIIVNHGTLAFAHSTISANHSMNMSGGIDNSGGGTVTLRSTIVAGNTTDHDSPDILGTVVSQGYNIIGNTKGTVITGDTTGNLLDAAAAPLYLGSLGGYGGPTQTLPLLPGSVAINTGNPAFTPPPAYDQRGPGYARVSGGRIDIGAYESQ